MKRALLVLWFASWACGQSTAITERPVVAPIPDYHVKRANAPITIDGRLDEPPWTQAGALSLHFPWKEQTGDRQATTVRVLWDDEQLYVGFDCVDADIVAHHTHRDDPTYEDDAVEVFLNPDPKLSVYVGLEINAGAVLYDYLNTFPKGLLKSYDLKGFVVAARCRGTVNDSADRDEGWGLEIAIPLKNFAALTKGRPVIPGTIWTAAFNRWDGIEPHRRLSMWSDSGRPQPNPHNPSRFGRLHFDPRSP